MALFHFHQQSPDGRIEDPEGSDLPDLAAARSEALQAARQMVAEAVLHGRGLSTTTILVTDDDDRPLLTIPFRDVLPDGLCPE